jgi:inner membrane protein
LEPITHFLTGAVLARAGFNRKTALATATMTLAAEAPDLDIFWRFKSPVYYFAHHRGFTHSFLGLFLMSGLTVGLVYVLWLLRGRRTKIPDLPPRWGLLFLFSYIAGLSHILLDFTNNYGVRPFWPFWEKWYSWDIVFIVEPALYIILITGLLLPAILSRHKPIPRGRGAARLALVCVVALYAIRDYEHGKAVRAIQFQAGAEFRSGAEAEIPTRVSVYPYYWTVRRWYAVAETRDFFVSADINSPTGTVHRETLERIPKPPETPATLAAKQSYLGRAYLDWAQYPLATEISSGEDAIVRFRDLRFDYPRFRGRITLSGSVELDKNLRVVREWFGPGQQQPPPEQ